VEKLIKNRKGRRKKDARKKAVDGGGGACLGRSGPTTAYWGQDLRRPGRRGVRISPGLSLGGRRAPREET